MTRKKEPTKTEPTIAPGRAITAFQGQLQKLAALKGRRHDEAELEETGWIHFTQSVVESAFDNPSSSLNKFHSARWAGQHTMGGMSGFQLQQNYDLRIAEFEVLLLSLIETLKLQLPEEQIQGVYAPGDVYAIYRDLVTLISQAQREVFIVDAYLDEDLFNLYAEKIAPGLLVKVLTNRLGTNVETVARKYAMGRPLQLRSSNAVHDRALFVDDRGWILGQSIKDAAKTKPTSVIELTGTTLAALRAQNEIVWASAGVVI